MELSLTHARDTDGLPDPDPVPLRRAAPTDPWADHGSDPWASSASLLSSPSSPPKPSGASVVPMVPQPSVVPMIPQPPGTHPEPCHSNGSTFGSPVLGLFIPLLQLPAVSQLGHLVLTDAPTGLLILIEVCAYFVYGAISFLAWFAKFAVVFSLRASSSSSLARLWSPSNTHPIMSTIHNLDVRFNLSVSEIMSGPRMCSPLSYVDQSVPWYYPVLPSPLTPDPVCSLTPVCHQVLNQAVETWRPSSLYANHTGVIHFDFLLASISVKVSSAIESLISVRQSVSEWALSFLTTHGLTLWMVYYTVPWRNIGSFLKLVSQFLRTR